MSPLTGGLDEVGYGAWAGPIISVIAVFPAGTEYPAGVKDSKQTTEKQRSALYLPLCQLATDVGIGYAWPYEIDKWGAMEALQTSYLRAIEELNVKPTRLIVDGKNKVKYWLDPQLVEPKADVKYQEVAAASIIAKHLRDTMMADYAKQHPQYGWERNRGYGTFDHEQAIKKHGLLVEGDQKTYLHRRLYCRKALIRGA